MTTNDPLSPYPGNLKPHEVKVEPTSQELLDWIAANQLPIKCEKCGAIFSAYDRRIPEGSATCPNCTNWIEPSDEIINSIEP